MVRPAGPRLGTRDRARSPSLPSRYFPGTREQFRISGSLEVVGESHGDERLLKARVQAWKNMSDAGRSQFAWPTPGIPRPDPNDKSLFDGPAPPADADPVPAFCLLLLRPDHVDHLCLRGNHRTEHRLVPDGHWESTPLNP